MEGFQCSARQQHEEGKTDMTDTMSKPKVTVRTMRQHELWTDFISDTRCGYPDTESETWDEDSWLTRFLEWLEY